MFVCPALVSQALICQALVLLHLLSESTFRNPLENKGRLSLSATVRLQRLCFSAHKERVGVEAASRSWADAGSGTGAGARG